MFFGVVSEEVHENIFWPNLPYITDEHRNICFQVKNNEDIMKTLNSEETAMYKVWDLTGPLLVLEIGNRWQRRPGGSKREFMRKMQRWSRRWCGRQWRQSETRIVKFKLLMGDLSDKFEGTKTMESRSPSCHPIFVPSCFSMQGTIKIAQAHTRIRGRVSNLIMGQKLHSI